MTNATEAESRRARRARGHMRTYRLKYPDRARLSHNLHRMKMKLLIFSHYGFRGEPRCVVCGERRMACLSIDHINGGGRQHLRDIGKSGGASFYIWLRKNDFPQGYQVLCMNCQMIKREENHELDGKEGKPYVN